MDDAPAPPTSTATATATPTPTASNTKSSGSTGSGLDAGLLGRNPGMHYRSKSSNMEDMADQMISRVIGKAAVCIQKTLGFRFSREESQLQMEIDDDPGHVAEDKLEYPSNGEFTPAKGFDLINQLIRTWDLSLNWDSKTEYLTEREDITHTLHLYRVIFTPSNTKRVIQVTAQVEILIRVNHLRKPDPLDRMCMDRKPGEHVDRKPFEHVDRKPGEHVNQSRLTQDEPVILEFRLEGQRFWHLPGKFRFREKWLTDIIENKKKLIRQISL